MQDLQHLQFVVDGDQGRTLERALQPRLRAFMAQAHQHPVAFGDVAHAAEHRHLVAALITEGGAPGEHRRRYPGMFEHGFDHEGLFAQDRFAQAVVGALAHPHGQAACFAQRLALNLFEGGAGIDQVALVAHQQAPLQVADVHGVEGGIQQPPQPVPGYGRASGMRSRASPGPSSLLPTATSPSAPT